VGATFILGLLLLQAAPFESEQALRRAVELRPGDPVLLSRLGGLLDRQQRCQEAEEIYSRAVRSGPPSITLLNNLGNHYVACGEPGKAAPYFERVLKTNPAHGNANLQLARIATDQRQGARALLYLAHVRDSAPAIVLLRAEASYWAGRREAALALLDRVRKEAAGDSRVLFSLGLTLARLGLYGQAETAFQEVLAKEPADFDVLFNLGRAASSAGDYDRARQVLEVALKLKPDDVDTLKELAQLRAAMRDYDHAILLLARARRIAPKRADVLLALARAAAEARYYGDSVLAYDEYLALRPGDDEIRRDRAAINGRIERAAPGLGLKEMTWYVGRHPADPLGHYDLALIFEFTDLDKALEELNTALRLDPKLGIAYHARAIVLHRLGRSADAIPDLEAALRIDPKDARPLGQLGLVYLVLEKPAEAEKVLRRAQALAPESPEICMRLGRALMELGREQEAQAWLDRFRDLRSRTRVHGTTPWLIEAAGLAPEEAGRRVIERLRERCRTRETDPEPRLQLGSALLAEGSLDEAARVFRELMALNPDAGMLHSAGTTLLRFEQYGLARDFLARAAAGRPQARLDLALAVASLEGPQPALAALGAPPEGERSGDYYLLKARLLDAAGERAEAERVLRSGLDLSTVRPRVARDAALLLFRLDRKTEAAALLDRVLHSTSDDADLLLTKAIILGLMGEVAHSETALKEVESRWPEWHRSYLAHGLLLEAAGRSPEARQKIQTALALGTPEAPARCALARLQHSADSDPQCRCWHGLRELLFPACGKGGTLN
jgi:tetratricopeptide (TPR) repeat protein